MGRIGKSPDRIAVDDEGFIYVATWATGGLRSSRSKNPVGVRVNRNTFQQKGGSISFEQTRSRLSFSTRGCGTWEPGYAILPDRHRLRSDA